MKSRASSILKLGKRQPEGVAGHFPMDRGAAGRYNRISPTAWNVSATPLCGPSQASAMTVYRWLVHA